MAHRSRHTWHQPILITLNVTCKQSFRAFQWLIESNNSCCSRPKTSSPELEKSLWNNKNIADAPESLLLFGNGDGGGGPTPDMLEKVWSPARFSISLCRGEKVAEASWELARTTEFSRHQTWRGASNQDRQAGGLFRPHLEDHERRANPTDLARRALFGVSSRCTLIHDFAMCLLSTS